MSQHAKASKRSKLYKGFERESLYRAYSALGNVGPHQVQRPLPGIDSVLADALKYANEDKLSTAYITLLSLRQTGQARPTGAQVWVLCDVLMRVASCCPNPRLLIQIAMEWTEETHAAQDWPGYLRAVVRVLNFLDALRDQDDKITALAHQAESVILKEGQGPTVSGIQCMLRIGLSRVKQNYQLAKAAYEWAHEFATGFPACPAALCMSIHNHLALLYRSQGDYVSRVRHLQQAMILSSDQYVAPQDRAGVSLDLALLMFDLRQFEQARKLIDPVLGMLRELVLTPPQQICRVAALDTALRDVMSRDRATLADTHDWRMCNNCGAIAENLAWCACHTVWYCNAECQLSHWPMHKAQCVSCAACGIVKEGMTRCSNCKSVRYCSTECSKAHWRDHKPVCIPVPVPVQVTVSVCKTCNSVNVKE